MKTPVLLAGALLAAAGIGCLPCAAAQTRAALPPAADPAAPVPAPLYRSVFAAPAGAGQAPAIDWRQANADVGQFRRGHADILQWEAAHTPPESGMPHAMPPAAHGTPGATP